MFLFRKIRFCSPSNPNFLPPVSEVSTGLFKKKLKNGEKKMEKKKQRKKRRKKNRKIGMRECEDSDVEDGEIHKTVRYKFT